MNFDDTPQEAAFRAEARAWIAANAPKEYEDELKRASLGRTISAGSSRKQKGENAENALPFFMDRSFREIDDRRSPLPAR